MAFFTKDRIKNLQKKTLISFSEMRPATECKMSISKLSCLDGITDYIHGSVVFSFGMYTVLTEWP